MAHSTPQPDGRIRLDNNATTRPYPEVVEAVAREMRDGFGNPGSPHADGRRARRALEEARESLAEILGADPGEVIFTSGGTEAINHAVFGFAARRGAGIALTRGEHPATLSACSRLEQHHAAELHWIEVDGEGRIDARGLDQLAWDRLDLVSVILAHNETGVIQDAAPLAAHCRERGIPLHLDAVQAVGKIPVHFHDLGATALSLAAHKFHGPRGIGALLLREGVKLPARIVGGHQESGRRAGTESVALAVGMAKALEIWAADARSYAKRVGALRDRLERGLSARCSPSAVNGSRAVRLPNTLNIAFPGVDGEALLAALDLEGVTCSLGSACASGSAEPAPVLLAMGCPPEVYRSAIRLSLSSENREADIDTAIEIISSAVNKLRQMAPSG